MSQLGVTPQAAGKVKAFVSGSSATIADNRSGTKPPPGDGEEHFPIPLAAMQPGTVTPIDLYIHYGSPGQYVLYKSANTHLREEIRERLLAHGVSVLYLKSDDRELYYTYVEKNLTSIVRDELMPAEKASELIYETSSRVMEETFAEPRSGRNLRRAHNVVEATVLSILNDPESIWHMAGMAGHDYYTFTHSVHVCMFLTAGCRDLLGITDSKMLRQIALGGIFHDIGKSQIPEEILNKPGKLTPEEFEKVKRHPTLGLGLVKNDRKLVAASARIIRGHHERWNGTGYPQGLSGEGIADIVRLSTVIDVYDALTTKRSYADARSPVEALELMMEPMQGHFDGELLRSFVRFLGPRDMRTALRARWNEEAAEALKQMAKG